MGKRGNTAYRELLNSVLEEALEEYPDLPNRTLARLLNQKYPTLFVTVERARGAIRIRRDALGEVFRKTYKGKRYARKSI